MAKEKEARPDKLTVNILGVDHVIVFNWWALSQFKKLTKIDIFDERSGHSFNPKDTFQLIALLWAGMITKKPEYDCWFLIEGQPSEKVQKLLQAIGKELVGEKVEEVANIVGEAVMVAMPGAQPKKK